MISRALRSLALAFPLAALAALALALLGSVAAVTGAQAQGVANTEAGPQTGLRVEPLSIATPRGVRSFRVEIADTPATREIGMMWRTEAPRGTGMLFDFHRPQPVAFWMKNTMIPLDLIYIRQDGTIARITTNAVPFSLVALPSGEPIRAVLELAGGEARRLGLAAGQRVTHRIFPAPAPASRPRR
jgi:uncharacterized protein